MKGNTNTQESGLEKLHIAAIFKEQLQMFRVQPELAYRLANLVGQRSVCRRASPAVGSAGVFELQDAAVGEVQLALIECGVDGVSNDVSFSVLGKVHAARLANLFRNCWFSFQDEGLNLGRDSDPVPRQARQHPFVAATR